MYCEPIDKYITCSRCDAKGQGQPQGWNEDKLRGMQAGEGAVGQIGGKQVRT